jgi:hypothetical protein
MKKKERQSDSKKLQAEWTRVRIRLGEFPDHFAPEKTIELLDLCTQSTVLQNLVPYVSLGRLCLSKSKVGEHYADDCPCMYYHKSHYTVSSYDNTEKYLFESAQRAIEYAERNIPMKRKSKE